MSCSSCPEISPLAEVEYASWAAAHMSEAGMQEFGSSLPCAGTQHKDGELKLWNMLTVNYSRPLELKDIPSIGEIQDCLVLYRLLLDAAEWDSPSPSPKAAAKALFRATSASSRGGSESSLTIGSTCVEILNSMDSHTAMHMLRTIHTLSLLARTVITCEESMLSNQEGSENRANDTAVTPHSCNHRAKRAAVCDNLDITKPYEPRCIEKSPETRRLLLSVVRHNVLFKNCSMDAHNAVVDAFECARPSAGDIVIQQGDPGDFFYIIESGALDVFVSSAADEKELKTGRQLVRGDYFGELALMCNTPRAATVRVSAMSSCNAANSVGSMLGLATSPSSKMEKCVLWKIDRLMYRSIVSHFSKLAYDTYVGLISNVKIAGSRRLGDILSSNELNRLVSSLEMEEFDINEVIVRQNATGDYFYIITDGCVDVFVESAVGHSTPAGSGLGNHIAQLSRGDYFGEKALLADDVRQASCVAAKPGVNGKVVCLSLSRTDFIALLGSWQDIEAAAVEETAVDITESSALATEKSAFQMAMKMDDLVPLSTLGVGAFGKVRKVTHKTTAQQFALKYQSKDFIVSQGMQDAIVSEMRITRMLQHPCIAQLYSAFQDAKYIYFCLELLPGGDFFNFLQSSGQLSEDKCRFYAASVVSAFECLHGNKIAYRDLKPENMVLDAKGYVKLVDLGLAKQILDGGNTWTMCGTPDYLAPEIVLNQGHDLAVDYWALGVLIYEIINGLPPFYHENSLRIFEKIAAGKLHFQDGMFSKNAEDLISKLLVKNPSRRLGNMKGKISDITKHKWFNSFDWHGLVAGSLVPSFIPPIMTAAEEEAVMKQEEKDDPVGESDWTVDLS